MFGFEDIEYRIFIVFVMALDAGVGSFFRVGTSLGGCRKVRDIIRRIDLGSLKCIANDKA
jgi:hypothetical protein